MSNYYERIEQQYKNLRGDSTELFREILAASTEIGLEQALAYLEQCVSEKRSTWLRTNLPEVINGNDPVMEGYRWFYEKYLGVSIPKDGEIVEHTEKGIIMRWWNPCPTLEACNQLGLDTREVCQWAYQAPVQEFLKHIHPRLRFDRNYCNIRPYAAYCEEIIELDDSSPTGPFVSSHLSAEDSDEKTEIIFITWCLLALTSLFSITVLLDGSLGRFRVTVLLGMAVMVVGILVGLLFL